MNLEYRVPDGSDSDRGKLRRFLLLAIEVCIWNPRTCFFSVPSECLLLEFTHLELLSKYPDKKEFRCHACQLGNIDNWIFTSAIGELRGVFGVMIGQIAKTYGLDVGDDWARIIPE